MRYLFARLALLTLLLTITLNVWATTSDQAQALIEGTTDEVLQVLKTDSGQIYTLVDKAILPHFDFVRMSRLVLARNWRKVSRDQKRRFIEGFRALLVRTYATALVDVAGKVDKIDYTSAKRGSKKATVRSKVYQQGKATPIEVSYFMYYHKKKKQWKVYNVTVGGVSLVTNYRSEFANDFRVMGIEGLINKIKNQNQDKS